MKVTDLETGDYPGLPAWAQSNQRSPRKWRTVSSPCNVAKGELGRDSKHDRNLPHCCWRRVRKAWEGTEAASQSKDQLTVGKETGLCLTPARNRNRPRIRVSLEVSSVSDPPERNTALRASWFHPGETLSRGHSWATRTCAANAQNCEVISECFILRALLWLVTAATHAIIETWKTHSVTSRFPWKANGDPENLQFHLAHGSMASHWACKWRKPRCYPNPLRWPPPSQVARER